MWSSKILDSQEKKKSFNNERVDDNLHDWQNFHVYLYKEGNGLLQSKYKVA